MAGRATITMAGYTTPSPHIINAENAKDIIFLFGAGASYGAGNIIPERPPLGIHLYTELEKNYPKSWGNIPSAIKQKFAINFEDGMADLYHNHNYSIPLLMQQLSIYFIQFRPNNNQTAYCNLIEQLKNNQFINRTIFSTLNYDCILECCLYRKGIHPAYFDAPKADEIPVLKLHGSSNMFSQSIQASRQIQFDNNIVFEGGITASLDPNEVIGMALSDNGLPPVMNIYMKGKPLNVSLSSINSLQGTWCNYINHAKIIFVIGVNPIPEDTHIWNVLQKTPLPIFFICDQNSAHNWITANSKSNCEYIGSYFEQSVEKIIEKISSI